MAQFLSIKITKDLIEQFIHLKAVNSKISTKYPLGKALQIA